ncbi:MAG: hypothetical protein U0974_15790 [Gemmatimonadales bacterium]|nr:hypothetical protein [Gemmatimonadales bacterium]
MLNDYRYAADLTLSDRLRLLADGLRDDPLDYAALQAAADYTEGASEPMRDRRVDRNPPRGEK